MTKDLWGYGVPGPGERTAAQWTPLIDDDGSEMLDHPSGMKALTFPGNGNGVHHWHVRSRSGKNVAKGRSATPQEAESSALHVMENPPPPYRYGPDDLEFGRYRHRGTDYQDGMAMVWPRGEFHGPDNWLSAITWGPSGEIGNVETHPDHRRRGLATQLFDYVKQNHRPDLRHSPTLSEDGKAWSRYEQSRTAARRTVAQRQLLHRGIPFPEGWVPAPDQFINSVGQHWTSDLSVAEAFSDPVTYGESFGSPDDNEYYRGTGAVVSAWHDPATAKPITDKEILHKLHGGDYPEDKEVTFSSGAPLEVHSIKYLPVGGQEWKEISGVQGNGITAHRTAMPQGGWYHASPHDIPVGTVLTPGGGPTQYDRFYDRTDQDRAGHVWVDTLRNVKRRWADPDHYIYRVEPHTEPQPFQRQVGQMLVSGEDGHTTSGATITKVVRRPPHTSARTASCSDDEYMHGQCAAWAVAHQREYPHLRFGIDWQRLTPDHPDWDEEDEGDEIWQPQHIFTHDDSYAYDVRGAHPLSDIKQWDDVTLDHSRNDVLSTGMHEMGWEPESDVVRRVSPHTAARTAMPWYHYTDHKEAKL